MKKHITNILYFFVVFSLLIIFLQTHTVYAKTVSLSSTFKTITVGRSATISLKNNTKKVSWSLSNQNAKITKKSNSKVTVKAVKKGTVNLYAKIGNKKYTCKIICKSNSLQNITFQNKYDYNTIYTIVTNKNNITVDIDLKFFICNSKGSIIDTYTNCIYSLEPGKKYVITWYSDTKGIDKNKSYFDYEVTKSIYKSLISNIKISNSSYQNRDFERYTICTLENLSNENCEELVVTALYYKDNKFIFADTRHMELNKKQKTAVKFVCPYDQKTFNDLKFDKYKIIVSTAVNYGY